MEENQPIKEETVQQGGQDETSGDSVPLDMQQYGDLEVKSGGSKPRFDKVTNAKIQNVQLRSQATAKKDDSGAEFYPVYLHVTFEVDNQQVYENYGGGRLFVSSEKGSRIWVGSGSSLGKLIDVVNNHFEFSGKLKDLPTLLQDRTAGIKTEEMHVAGKAYSKNAIQHFV